MKNSFSLVRQGFSLFLSLIPRRVFLWSYLFFFGIYDISYSLYLSAVHADSAFNRFCYFLGNVLIVYMGVLVLLILHGIQPLFTSRTRNLTNRGVTASLVSGIYILLGFICLIIPGFILLRRYLYTVEAVVLEDLTFNAALARSRKLSSVNGWRSLWAISIVSIVCMSAYFFPLFLYGIVMGFMGLTISESVIENNFAYIFWAQSAGSITSIIVCSVRYAGYLDACASELEVSTASVSTSGRKGELVSSPAIIQDSDVSADDRSLGRTYAQALANCSTTSLQQRLALLSDLFGENRSLWSPLRHLIEQPGFLTMLQDPSHASRIAARDALLQDLDSQYMPHVMQRVRQFVEGLLED